MTSERVREKKREGVGMGRGRRGGEKERSGRWRGNNGRGEKRWDGRGEEGGRR